MGLALLYSLLDAVKSKNSGLKTWFGIWNLGLESKIFNENGGILNLARNFNLVSGPSLVAISLATPCVKYSTGHRSQSMAAIYWLAI